MDNSLIIKVSPFFSDGDEGYFLSVIKLECLCRSGVTRGANIIPAVIE